MSALNVGKCRAPVRVCPIGLLACYTVGMLVVDPSIAAGKYSVPYLAHVDAVTSFSHL